MILAKVFTQALTVTTFVAVMMLLVEYFNVMTKGRAFPGLRKNQWLQYVTASFLGATPGCLGAFTSVALYSHGLLSRGALVSAMVATTGDEAFIMFALIPKTAALLTVGLFVLGIVVGVLVDLALPAKSMYCRTCHTGMPVHEHQLHLLPDFSDIREHCLHCSPFRGVMMSVFFIVLLMLVLGGIGPEKWNWIKWTVVISLFFAFWVVITVPEHFLKEHLWNHLFREHVPRIFLWTLGALLFLNFLVPLIHIKALVHNNPRLTTLGAALLGIIPESGPHMVLVFMYHDHALPFTPLLANSIVQDGHGLLPLLAESWKDFVFVKAVALVTGLIAATAWMLLFKI